MLGPSIRKRLTLYDSDGAPVAQGGGGLHFPITLQTLDKCRDADGNPRLWTLDAGETIGPVSSSERDVDVSATVVAETRISTRVLQDRINLMIGEQGEKISIYGEIQGADLLARLKILDEVGAETIDMWGLLDSVIESDEEHPDIAVNVSYVLYRKGLPEGVDVSLPTIGDINIRIGASEKIQPSIPALKMDVGVEGSATVEYHGIPIGTAKIRDNRISLEAGLRLTADGSFKGETWISHDLIDVDVD